MPYHIVLRQVEDFAQVKAEAKLGHRPKPDIVEIQERLNASVHIPNAVGSHADRRFGLLEGKPENWALARQLVRDLDDRDVIYCVSEDAAIPIAALCAGKANRPRIVSFFHNFIRPRGLLSTQLFRVAATIDRFLVVSDYQGQFLQRYLNVPASRIQFVWDKVDVNFFVPGSASTKARPVIASVGLENRDYKLIAAATHNMNVDVRISGASPHAKQLKRSLPRVMPVNMSRRFYAWSELRQLYQTADLVVVSAFECGYAAGVTSLLEAMACKRPVIATKTKGLAAYCDSDAILTIRPGNVKGLQQAITHLLQAPQAARERAERGYELAHQRHSVQSFASTIVDQMQQLHGDHSQSPIQSVLSACSAIKSKGTHEARSTTPISKTGQSIKLPESSQHRSQPHSFFSRD